MSELVTFNGSTYIIPDVGDATWGQNVTNFLVAIPSGCLQKTGGVFTLTADANFGASFGLLSSYFKSRGANAASSGLVRAANADTFAWRNAANTGNNALGVNGSDQLVYNGSPLAFTALADGQILVGNASNIATAVSMAGDIAITNAGVTSIQPGVVTNADVSPSAAIAYSKLNLTGSILNSDVYANAGIAYSKLNLTGSILNSDIYSAAAISLTKLAPVTPSSVIVSDSSGFATVGAGTMGGNLSLGNHSLTHITDGSVANPAISGNTNSNNGIAFEVHSNSVSVVTGGTEACFWNGSQQYITGINGGGTQAVDLIPAIGMNSDGGTGIGLPIVDVLGLVAGASWAATVSKSQPMDSQFNDTFSMYQGTGGTPNFGCYAKFKNGTVIGLSTTATTVTNLDGFGGLTFVLGNDGTNYFFDAVICGFSGSPTVLFRSTTTGSPTARTYTNVSNHLKLAMASGTYNIQTTSFQMQGR